MSSGRRILVVEDNRTLAMGLCNNLKLEGYRVEHALDGERALQVATTFDPEVVILDLMLPKLNGYEVLKRLREAGSSVPVLILSALGEEVAKVRGFRMGADQYVTKPFSIMELVARIESLLRRVEEAEAKPGMESAARYWFGNIEVDVAARTVTRDGTETSLTPKAFDLLTALLRRDGAVATRQELLKEVWTYDESVVSRTVDVHIAELRRRLEESPSKPQYILTAWKRGYRLKQH